MKNMHKTMLAAAYALTFGYFAAMYMLEPSVQDLRADLQHEVVKVTVYQGDTLEGICNVIFDQNKDGRHWERFKFDAMESNRHLMANGRYLQPGDVVQVEIWK